MLSDKEICKAFCPNIAESIRDECFMPDCLCWHVLTAKQLLKEQEAATQTEERKALGKWLEERPSAHSTDEYKGHYHLVTHLNNEPLSRGEKPSPGG